VKIQERVDEGIESNVERVDSNSSVGLRFPHLQMTQRSICPIPILSRDWPF